MVFSTGLFTLYVLPRFAAINNQVDFTKEVFHIYKTILPIFAIGMLLIYWFRDYIIQIIYPEFTGMSPLFKWQLLGDFIRLCSLVIAHQFLAKRMVKSFVITEILSLASFYILSLILIKYYSTEGVVMAHFFRYILYFVVVFVPVVFYFKKFKNRNSGFRYCINNKSRCIFYVQDDYNQKKAYSLSKHSLANTQTINFTISISIIYCEN